MDTIDEKYEKGCLLLELGRMDEAWDIFLSILTENTDYYPALNKIGVIYANKGDLYKAQEYFEQALDINKKYAPALVNLGNILKEGGNFKEAERFYLAAIDEDPDYATAYHNMAVMYKEKNLYEMYIKYIKEYKRAYKRHSYSKDIRQRVRSKSSPFMKIVLSIAITIFIILLLFSTFFA